MGTAEFLISLLPEQGLKVIAEGGINPATGKFGFRHQRAFESIEEAAQFCAEIDARKQHAFFAVASYRDKRVWNEKTNKWSLRLQTNTLNIKCLFMDLDVDADNPKKFSSKKEALTQLQAFIAKVGLPEPMIVDSGGGLHIYWPFTEEITTGAWQPLAEGLKQLCKIHGFKIDLAPAADCSRVLRPAGTHNHKRDVPRPVKVLLTTTPVDPESLRKIITNSMPAGFDSTPPPKVGAVLGTNTQREYDHEPLNFRRIVQSCAQFRSVAAEHGNVEEPLWYAALQVARLCSKPEKAIAIVSDGHPEYTEEATAKKVQQLTSQDIGPTTCARFDDLNPGLCRSCPHWEKIKSPAVLGKTVREAPPPVVEVKNEETGVVDQITIPNPPKPYIRRERGGIILQSEDAEGTPVTIVIYEHDIYPVRREFLEQTEEESIVWRARLPKEGWVEFSVRSSALYDATEALKEMSAKGVYPSLDAKDQFKRFLVAYVQELQRQAEAERVFAKLGWRDDNFVLASRLITPTGPQHVRVSNDAKTALPGLQSAGSLEAWRGVMDFWNRPGYEPNMFTFLTGFGAPLLGAVGLQGSIVHMEGPSGAGKSLVLLALCSVWGNPVELMLNGTPEGSTYNARVKRIAMHNNVPVALDEITKMDAEEASALCYMISQGKGKLRLTRSGKDQGNVEQWCTMLASSGNDSLYLKLSNLQADASAQQARVFEVKVPLLADHLDNLEKRRAVAFFNTISANYGTAGERYIQAVVSHKAEVFDMCGKLVERFDMATSVGSVGRFWTATAAVNLVGARVAISAGVLPWTKADLQRLEQWVIQQIRGIARTINEGATTPEALIAEYLDEHVSDMLVVGAPTGIGYPVVTHPKRELNIRHEPATNTIWVSRASLKAYCQKRHANFNDVAEHLIKAKVITRWDHNNKKILGTGTQYSGAQVRVLTINTAHPSLAGVTNTC